MARPPQTPNFAQVARRAERQYSSALRQVAKAVQQLIGAHTATTFQPLLLEQALRRYSILITPWAMTTAARMVVDSSLRNRKALASQTMEIGKAMRIELQRAPTGAVMRQLQEAQVTLIKSLPLEAAEKVQTLVREALPTSARSATLVDDIMKLGSQTEGRARTIARTETSKAQSTFTRARAEYVGSEGYIWRTSRDGNVRDSHREMDGKYVRWGSPPRLSDGTVTHAGEIYNCRCWAEPVLPEIPVELMA